MDENSYENFDEEWIEKNQVKAGEKGVRFLPLTKAVISSNVTRMPQLRNFINISPFTVFVQPFLLFCVLS